MLAKFVAYLDGLKTYLVCAGDAVYTLVTDWNHLSWGTVIRCVFDLGISLGRAYMWKPGALSGAELMHTPDGGAIVVKPGPDPEQGA